MYLCTFTIQFSFVSLLLKKKKNNKLVFRTEIKKSPLKLLNEIDTKKLKTIFINTADILNS